MTATAKKKASTTRASTTKAASAKTASTKSGDTKTGNKPIADAAQAPAAKAGPDKARPAKKKAVAQRLPKANDKTQTKPQTKTRHTAQTDEQATPPSAPRTSALSAAATILADAPEPMSAKQLIDAMAERKLWSSPAGKTPSATLYAALIREIGKKGDASRFAKAGRGRFARRRTDGSI